VLNEKLARTGKGKWRANGRIPGDCEHYGGNTEPEEGQAGQQDCMKRDQVTSREASYFFATPKDLKSSVSGGALAMKIGVLGSGTVGQTLAAGFLKHGHEVMVGTRDPGGKALKKWYGENPKGRVGTFAETAKFGELLLIATQGRVVTQVIEMAGRENFTGKVLIDVNNPIADTPPVNGVLEFFTGPSESLGETIQAFARDARVVKAFNSVGAVRMINPHYEQGTPTMFIAGEDAAAKETVSGLIRELGWEPFDCGGIIASRALEPLCMLWCIPGFRQNQWTHAFKLLTH
jgi:predicted dinucleotide-binding enzyme